MLRMGSYNRSMHIDHRLRPPVARSRSGTASDSKPGGQAAERGDHGPSETSTGRHDRECHVEGIDVVQLASTTKAVGLGDRRDERQTSGRAPRPAASLDSRSTTKTVPWRAAERSANGILARTTVRDGGAGGVFGLLGVPNPAGPSRRATGRTRERFTVRDGARAVAVPPFVHRVRGKSRSTGSLRRSGHRCVTTLPRV